MPEKLSDVVVWKDRTIPDKRVIPDHLKLAILSRGRLKLPSENAEWLLDVVRENGQSWPDRLRRPLPEIFDDLRVTVDLFQNQRRAMTMADIKTVLENYLILYRLKYLPDCLVVWQALSHDNRDELETNLDTDLSLLFQRPRVRPDPRKPKRYILLVYACIPTAIHQYIAPERATPPVPAQRMPRLDAITSPSTSYNIRDSPGEAGRILGKQVGDVISVWVTGKDRADEHIWYELKLKQPLQIETKGNKNTLAAGTRCWMVGWQKKESGWIEWLILNKGPTWESGGLEYLAASWDFFRYQLQEFERENTSLSVPDRITKLRQMSHRKEFPFDYVIGAKSGTVYLDSLPYKQSEWQLFKDYQAVRVPDGRIVDLHHLFVGLDVLRRTERPVVFAGIPIGSNWAASTWAGDLGAAAVDLELCAAEEWEERNQNASFADRAEYYFNSRGASWDLLADIDVWGIHALHAKDIDTIDDLLSSYYGHTVVEGARTVTSARRDALERFLAHYGFHYDIHSDYKNYPVFTKQRTGVQRVATAIAQFAKIWKFKQNPVGGEATPDPNAVNAMTAQFLYWLEYQAIENRASVPESG